MQSMESHHIQNNNKKDVSFTIFLLNLQQLLDYENWECSEYILTLSVNSKNSISDYNFRIFCIIWCAFFSVFDKPFHIFTYIHVCMYMYEYMSSYIWAWQPFFLRSKYNLLSLHFYTEKDNITFMYFKWYFENSLRVMAVFIFHSHWGGTSCAATTLAERGCKVAIDSFG